MKVIIAGSREGAEYKDVVTAVKHSGFDITEVVSGAARGVDTLGEQWANDHGVQIKQFPAEWNELGKIAGFTRNIHMANYADALIAVWDGASHGTRHMIQAARDNGLEVYVFRIEEVYRG